MTTALLLVTFGLALWLGLYLIHRDPANPPFLWTGLGLVSYALSLALLGVGSEPPLLGRLQWATALLPALLWTGTLGHLLPAESVARRRLLAAYRASLLPLGVVVVALGAASGLPLRQGGPGLLYLPLALIVLAPLVAALALVLRSVAMRRDRRPLGVVLLVTVLFGLATGLMLTPFDLVPRATALFVLGLDLLFLGLGVGLVDAFDQGEAFLPDALRSLAGSTLVAAVLVAQVLVAAALAGGPGPALTALLLGVTATAVALQTVGDRLQGLLDLLALRRRPAARKAREELRAVAAGLARADAGLKPEGLDEQDFTRLTRRALSSFGNLGRLASSPLLYLPQVDARLSGAKADTTLERAQTLKALLAESILRLKPPGGEAFGTGETWRAYNVLYFPYVLGLRPFNQRVDHGDLDEVGREVLEWFRTHVPERTYYNWQTAAAELVARDLREGVEAGPSAAT